MSKQKNDTNDSEEEDYMSNDILNQIEDTRPGLVHSRSVAKRYEAEKKKKEFDLKNKKLSAKESFEESLKKSTLSSDNKGFNLMVKMGYKMGEPLGPPQASNDNQNETTNQPMTSDIAKRLIEPIQFTIKNDREGLGKRKLNRKSSGDGEISLLKKDEIEKLHSEYLDSKRSKFELRKLKSNLKKCQAICFQLDSTKSSLKQPKVKFYWPKAIMRSLKLANSQKKELTEQKVVLELIEQTVEEESNSVDEESETSTTKPSTSRSLFLNETNKIDANLVYQERLNKFLSSSVEETKTINEEKKRRDSDQEFNDDDIMLKHDKDYLELVAKEREKSEDETCGGNDESGQEEDDDDYDDDEKSISNKIDTICLYLRDTYFYCVWCASTFSSDSDLNEYCPGLTEKHHDEDT